MITLEQLVTESRRHCEGCDQNQALRPGSVTCAGTFIAFVNGRCRRDLWDHSRPIRYSPPPRPGPIPRERWGEGLAEWIAQKCETDKGVGSTLKRIGTAQALAVLHTITHGSGCKCADRVATANTLYPY